MACRAFRSSAMTVAQATPNWPCRSLSIQHPMRLANRKLDKGPLGRFRNNILLAVGAARALCASHAACRNPAGPGQCEDQRRAVGRHAWPSWDKHDHTS
eukprot:4569601-Amphidinium_carterae.6